MERQGEGTYQRKKTPSALRRRGLALKKRTVLTDPGTVVPDTDAVTVLGVTPFLRTTLLGE